MIEKLENWDMSYSRLTKAVGDVRSGVLFKLIAYKGPIQDMFSYDQLSRGIDIESHEPDIIFKPLVNSKHCIRHTGISINLPCACKNIVPGSYVVLTDYGYTADSRDILPG